MILSNVEIVRCLKTKAFKIEPIDGLDPLNPPFDTCAVDLRLSNEILIPKQNEPVQIDLTNRGGIPKHLSETADKINITDQQPYSLKPNIFILAKTLESVSFPVRMKSKVNYSARVEGKSSAARYGLIIHFTAPTIHAGFDGNITLEMINLGPHTILLKHKMYICQLTIEEVKGDILKGDSMFRGQKSASGLK